MSYFKEGESYLVSLKESSTLRIATYCGPGKAWGSNDWRGDTGFSSDSWLHEAVEFALPLSKLHYNVNGDTKEVNQLFYDNTK